MPGEEGALIMAMHYARIEESERLQRVHKLLADGGWHGTRDIVMAANVMAVNSIITELRANGYDIRTRCAGRGRYEYQLQVADQGRLF
jgi:hypothetical protein